MRVQPWPGPIKHQRSAVGFERQKTMRLLLLILFVTLAVAVAEEEEEVGDSRDLCSDDAVFKSFVCSKVLFC